MSETARQSLPLMEELIAILPEGCQECFFALDNIAAAQDAERQTGQVDSKVIAENIKNSCLGGWQDEGSPQKSRDQETGDPGLREAVVIEKFCPLGGSGTTLPPKSSP